MNKKVFGHMTEVEPVENFPKIFDRSDPGHMTKIFFNPNCSRTISKLPRVALVCILTRRDDVIEVATPHVGLTYPKWDKCRIAG